MIKTIMKGNGQFVFLKPLSPYSCLYAMSDIKCLDNLLAYSSVSWEYTKLIEHFKINGFKIISENLSDIEWLDQVQSNFKEGV